MKILVLNPFTLDPDSHSISHGTINDQDSLTVQADAESSDINFIVKQFGVTGMLPYGRHQPFYDDVSDIPNDYRTALDLVRQADNEFLQLSSGLRDRFGNNPQSFFDFIHDSSNRDEAISLGLIPAPSPSEPVSGDNGDGANQA